MNKIRRTSVAIASVVLAVCIVGSFLTQGAMQQLPSARKSTSAPSGSATETVDQRVWQTAQAVAGLAVSTEEKGFARDAERLADHEVDQAFAQALRQATAETHALTGEALALQQKVTELQETVKADKALVAQLTAKAAAAEEESQIGDDLDVAKAQLGLDNDELSDAEQDLARVGGDQRGRIQQELSAREASMKKYDAELNGSAGGIGQSAVVSAEQHGTLAARIKAWFNQRSREKLVAQAEQEARSDAATLTAQHNQLEANAKAAEVEDSAAKAKGSAATGAGRVKLLQKLAAQRSILSILDDRIATQQQLATVYARWQQQLQLQHRIVAHLMLQSFAWIAFIVLAMTLVGWGLQAALERVTDDRRRKETLRTILNLATELVGLLLVLTVIFGAPNQTPTILGLATAGLTVVFQDFILAFFGWFVLMGKNGIRVGDWVEINSVGGEVVEIGLFRTSLLETGNWTANGHPTGRRVSFINSFAIRGQYFNFSTTGQWMWDEIQIHIPAGVHTYPLIEKIHAAVLHETAADAKLAEAEWKRGSQTSGMAQFSATPSVDLRPAPEGIDIVVRYVTRAGARLEMRNKLYGKVVELMQGSREIGEGSGDAALAQGSAVK